MVYGSVCSGIEAATVAWEPLGWKPAWFSEIDKFPSAVLAHHYPTVNNHGDFTRITPELSGHIDILVGGTPCQAFSVAGNRAGLDDPRGNLTMEYLRLAERLKPKWIVWENVPGVLSIDGGRTFGTFLGTLGELGYGFSYRVLDAQNFGVPQRRRRVFVVGRVGNWRASSAVLLERQSLCWDSKESRKEGQEIAGTFTSRAKSGGRGTDVDLASSGYMRPVAMCLNAGGMGRIDAESETLISTTLSAGSDGNQVEAQYVPSSYGVRRLTPTECERLQGFPDGYTQVPYRGKPSADGPRYKALGNSMAVPCMSWIGARLDYVDRCLRYITNKGLN